MEPDAVQKQNKPFECRIILRRCSYPLERLSGTLSHNPLDVHSFCLLAIVTPTRGLSDAAHCYEPAMECASMLGIHRIASQTQDARRAIPYR